MERPRRNSRITGAGDKGVAQFRNGREATSRLLLQTTEDGNSDVTWQMYRSPNSRRRFQKVLPDELACRLACKCRVAIDHLVQNQSERIDVRGNRRRLLRQLL